MFSCTLPLNLALEGGWSRSCPCCFTPLPWKTQYPLYRRLGGSQGWSGQVWKISPPLGFYPWTVQPVAFFYTDYAIPADHEHVYLLLGSKYTRTFNKWLDILGRLFHIQTQVFNPIKLIYLFRWQQDSEFVPLPSVCFEQMFTVSFFYIYRCLIPVYHHGQWNIHTHFLQKLHSSHSSITYRISGFGSTTPWLWSCVYQSFTPLVDWVSWWTVVNPSHNVFFF